MQEITNLLDLVSEILFCVTVVYGISESSICAMIF